MVADSTSETSASEPIIREVSANDVDAVAALAPLLGDTTVAWVDRELAEAAVRQRLQSRVTANDQRSTAAYVAELDGVVVGFVAAERQTCWTGEAQVYLGQLIVADEVQGRGLGGALVRRVEQWAHDLGIPRLVLETWATNDAALGFYHRQGFQTESVCLHKTVGDGSGSS